MRNGLVALVVGGVLVVVACGGGGTAGPTAAPAAEAPAAAESSAPADGGTATGSQPSAEASVAAPASQAPAGGGGAAAGVCELVTADELKGIFGVTVTMTVVPGPPDNCIVNSEDGNPLTAWSLTTAQASAVYGAFTSDPSTVEVTGVGDKAAIVQNTGLLVLKGSNLLVVTISGGADMSEEEAIGASKKIGALAASRL